MVHSVHKCLSFHPFSYGHCGVCRFSFMAFDYPYVAIVVYAGLCSWLLSGFGNRQTLVNRMYHLAKLISGTRYEKSGKFNRATQKTKDRETQTLLKTDGCSGRIRSFCSTSSTRCTTN
jgi:hypothetical protein